MTQTSTPNPRAREWLEETLTIGKKDFEWPIHKYLSYLLVCAGSWEPSSFGTLSTFANHQRGLTVQEFCAFQYYSGYLWGMAHLDPSTIDLFEFYFKQYVIDRGLEGEYALINFGKEN